MTSLTRNSSTYTEGFFLISNPELWWLQLIFILWPPFVCIVFEEEKEEEKKIIKWNKILLTQGSFLQNDITCTPVWAMVSLPDQPVKLSKCREDILGIEICLPNTSSGFLPSKPKKEITQQHMEYSIPHILKLCKLYSSSCHHSVSYPPSRYVLPQDQKYFCNPTSG